MKMEKSRKEKKRKIFFDRFDPARFSCYAAAIRENFFPPASSGRQQNRPNSGTARPDGRNMALMSPRTLLALHALHPQKRLGQNFLSDPSTAQMIVRRADVRPEEIVVEIGPGLGALTIPLSRAARRVFAIEKDHHLCEILRAELQSNGISNVDLLEADALHSDLAGLAPRPGQCLTVFGNLPYNISSQIVIRLIEARRHVSRAVLMFQRELAARLAAPPGGKDYGRITAMLATCATVKPVCRVGAKSFYPAPKVDAEVLELVFAAPPAHPLHDEARLFRLIAAAFGQRRKTLKNALSASELSISPGLAARALERAGIDPARRAETLSAEEFVALEISLRSMAPE
jgi:16S rRNA (adenine1518-N6/adenine1519-N6)-dimethyltransferase